MPEWALHILSVAGVAVGAYAAIRADLAALHVKAQVALDSAGQAHRRLDVLMGKK